MRARLLVPALGLTQILGWGCSYFLPGALGGAIEAELGLPAGASFTGIAIQLGLAGLLAPATGRWLDRHGARSAMAAGSACFAAGLALLAVAPGVWVALAACLLLGLGGALALTEAANAALATLGREGARRRFGLMAVLSGMASFVAWPLLSVAAELAGWRGAALAAALAHLLIALPVHLWVLPRGVREARPPRIAAGPLPPALRLLSVALTLQVVVGSAVLANMVGIVVTLGLDGAAAIFWASLVGPAQVAARLLDVLGGARASAVRIASAALLSMPLVLVLPFVAPGLVPVFVIAWGLTSGLMSVMRPALLIEIHGTEGYATMAGRVMAPVTFAMAVGPAIVAPLLAGAGAAATLLPAALVLLLAFMVLRRAVRLV